MQATIFAGNLAIGLKALVCTPGPSAPCHPSSLNIARDCRPEPPSASGGTQKQNLNIGCCRRGVGPGAACMGGRRGGEGVQYMPACTGLRLTSTDHCPWPAGGTNYRV